MELQRRRVCPCSLRGKLVFPHIPYTFNGKSEFAVKLCRGKVIYLQASLGWNIASPENLDMKNFLQLNLNFHFIYPDPRIFVNWKSRFLAFVFLIRKKETNKKRFSLDRLIAWKQSSKSGKDLVLNLLLVPAVRISIWMGWFRQYKTPLTFSYGQPTTKLHINQ